MTKNVFLKGKTIYLRSLEEEDLTAEYLQWLNDEEVCEFNSHATYPNNKSKMRSYFESQGSNNSVIVFAILTNDGDKHIGNISLQGIQPIHRSAEFAILMGDKNYWGQGVATEASLIVVNYAFERLNLHRIHCGTSSKNVGMQKLAAKLKMREEGRRIGAMYKNGNFVDIVEYGVLKDEFYA